MSEDYTIYESTMNKNAIIDEPSNHYDLSKYTDGSIGSSYENTINELTKKQIQYTIRNYVRKEKFNRLERQYNKDVLILLDKISELERKVEQLYYPMRTIK